MAMGRHEEATLLSYELNEDRAWEFQVQWRVDAKALMERQVRWKLKGQRGTGCIRSRPDPSSTGPALLERFSMPCIIMSGNVA